MFGVCSMIELLLNARCTMPSPSSHPQKRLSAVSFSLLAYESKHTWLKHKRSSKKKSMNPRPLDTTLHHVNLVIASHFSSKHSSTNLQNSRLSTHADFCAAHLASLYSPVQKYYSQGGDTETHPVHLDPGWKK